MTAPNTVPLTWNSYVAQIANLAIVDVTTTAGVTIANDAAFNTLMPQLTNYAELRIQRDLDLLPLLTSNNSYSLTPANNTLAIDPNDFVTIQTVSIGGTPLMPVTKEFLQNVYGTNANQAQPGFYAMVGGDSATGGNTSNNIMVGPWPDAGYQVSLFGTIRAPSLYKFANASDAATKTTFISTNLPDLMIMAGMIYISAFQRNFGKMSDDPEMAMSYEGAYKALLPAAGNEEMRKKFQASAWSSMSPAVAATPNR